MIPGMAYRQLNYDITLKCNHLEAQDEYSAEFVPMGTNVPAISNVQTSTCKQPFIPRILRNNQISLILKVTIRLTRSRPPLRFGISENVFEIINSQRDFENNMSNFVLSTVTADGLVWLDTRPSADTVMIGLEPCMHTRPKPEGSNSTSFDHRLDEKKFSAANRASFNKLIFYVT